MQYSKSTASSQNAWVSSFMSSPVQHMAEKTSKNLISRSLWTPLNYATPQRHWPLSHYRNYCNLQKFCFFIFWIYQTANFYEPKLNLINNNRLAAKIFSSYAKGWCWGWGCTTGMGLCLGPFCFTIRATKRGRWVNRTVWTVSQSPNDALSQGNFFRQALWPKKTFYLRGFYLK